jgi:ABC-type anion transport system duplicated permease subunit
MIAPVNGLIATSIVHAVATAATTERAVLKIYRSLRLKPTNVIYPYTAMSTMLLTKRIWVSLGNCSLSFFSVDSIRMRSPFSPFS